MIKSKLLFVIVILLCTFKIISQEVVEKDYNTFQEFLIEQNRKISKIKNDLNIKDVKEIMGASIIVNVPKVGKMKPLNKMFKQPIYLNKYKSNPEKIVLIYWYFTTPKDQDGIISKKECTPVVFENDSVAGYGWEFFNTYRRTNILR